MDPKFVAGVIRFSTRRKSPVAGPSGEPCVGDQQSRSMRHFWMRRDGAVAEGMPFSPKDNRLQTSLVKKWLG